MLLLLDSSNTKLMVAIADDDKVIDEVYYEAWQCQSEHMVDEINNIFVKHNLSRNDLTGVICSVGPGSYTGIRIALTIAKIICVSLSLPLFAISSLRVLKNNDKKSICLINARSGRSYFGVFEGNMIVEEDRIISNEDLSKYILEHQDYCLCGDLKYLSIEGYCSDIAVEMLSIYKDSPKFDSALGVKPVYLKD